MMGYIVVLLNDIIYSNKINKSLSDITEEILYRKFDEYFMLDIKEGRFTKNLKDVHLEIDFEVAIDSYIDISEWVISIDTNDVNIYDHGILVDKKLNKK